MIPNDSQLRRTRREIERLRGRMAGLHRKRVGKEMLALQEASLFKMRRDLEEQVRAYRDATRGRVLH